MNHVMIDLETLGTVASAVILSIGAVKFDLESGAIADDGFYASISIDSNLDYGRRIQEDTLLWWLKQPAAAQQVFHENKMALPEALESFSDWMETDDKHVWSNGADFDLPMIAHAYHQVQLTLPWKYWNSNCVRTYKKLPGARDVKIQTSGVKHNALSDAYNQAQLVCAIHKKLFIGQSGHSITKVAK